MPTLARTTPWVRSVEASLRTALAYTLAVVTSLLVQGCLTPPVVMKAPGADSPENLLTTLGSFPPGSEVVEVKTPGGAVLRGVFAPACDGAPLVLHLLGAAQSPASLGEGISPAAWSLADRGFGSLVLDYRGVGGSDGERDARNLREDAACMWAEALRRVDGDPGRVVIRATSLGAITTALAIEQGARPGAVLLVAPVFPGNIVERFASDSYGWFVGFLAACVYRPVARVDVLAQLRASGAPLCVTLFHDDTWANKDQVASLYEIARAAPSHSWSVTKGDHMGGVVSTSGTTFDERDFLSRTEALHAAPPRSIADAWEQLSPLARGALGAAPAAAQRFVALAARYGLVRADALAAAALELPDIERAQVWVDLLRYVNPPQADFESLRIAYSHAGSPEEPLAQALAVLSPLGLLVRRGVARDASGWTSPNLIAENLRALDERRPVLERVVVGKLRSGRLGLKWPIAFTHESVRSTADVRRVLARAALKLAGFADRLVVGPAGETKVEVRESGAWRALEIDPERPTSLGATAQPR